MKNKITYFLLICGLLAVTATSCKDDLLYADDGPVPEGEAMVTARIDFRPLAEGLGAKSRTAGDVIKSINDLYVLLYNTAGELVEARSLTETQSASAGENQFYVNDITRKDEDADNGKAAELKTPSAHLKLTVPYGRYYIYAVANMGEDFKEAVTIYKEESHASSESVKSYWNAIQKRESLKAITLTWKTEVVQNNQMFGCFTLDGETTEESLLTINKKDMKLHSWIRRAASKVTIAYDGSDLKENVYIYLKSVQIKDIPTECYLGKESAINKDAEDKDHNFGDLIADGEMITYTDPANMSYNERWPARITKGSPYYYTGCEKSLLAQKKEIFETNAHTETTDALFFYENMQGTGKDKSQDADGNGELDHPGLPDRPDEYPNYKLKDGKPYGTYIEVKAYYVSNHEDRVGSGDITYRFMLGKNVTTDYNAERNYHYKLTLKFKNYANDVDWHIEYEEPKPGIEVPNPYYISYLYNRTMNLPVKINTAGGELVSLEANILTNNWAPHGAYTGSSDQLDYAYWYDYEAVSQKEFSYNAYPVDIPRDERERNFDNPWNGFLSLRKTRATILTTLPVPDDNDGSIIKIKDNKEYYEATGDHPDHASRGKRIYVQDSQEQHESDDADGVFTLEENKAEKTINVSVPLYTRAKQMVISSGYTGNNPYVAYQRRATVEFKAQLRLPGESNLRVVSDTVEVFQVRRIVNPKGIYRSHKNTSSFHVTLMRLPKENATQFESFLSEGPWKAEIAEGSDNFISLSQTEGSTGTPIDFTVNFKGECKADESRHAVIRINYHNMTCQHLIFVRQGDAPVALLEGKARWHTYNLVSGTQETKSPLDEGSLFRFGNLNQPIAASNQVNSKLPWINVVPEYFDQPGLLDLVGEMTPVEWDKITNVVPSETATNWSDLNLPNGGHVATFEDFRALFSSPDIEQGYGVLYGDEATETAISIDDVYGYRWLTDKDKSEHYGMRGCFVYNKKTCRNLFFPIGASGYGHRRTKENGTLRYSCGRIERYPDTKNTELINRPLFYDLYMRPGAIYWLDRLKADALSNDGSKGPAIGWDFNYFTFDFNHIIESNIFSNGKSDACFIRCVEDPN